MTQTRTLRRWDVTGKHQLACVGFELPELPADRVRLSFICNGICGSDTHMFHTGAVHPGHKGAHQPLTLGHELIARVEECGESVTGLAVGDVVAVEPGLPCGTCANCRKGRYHCCPKTMYMGTPPQNGGLADEFHWPGHWCHKLPASLAANPVLASLVEPLAACRQALELRNRIVPERAEDEWTVIVGTGAMALGVLAVIKATNKAEKVMVIGRSAKALKFAKDFGADLTLQLSGIDPKATAESVLKDRAELFRTDHFDSDETLEAEFADDAACLAAAKAAREAAKRVRAHGAHLLEIEAEMSREAISAAANVLIKENAAVMAQAQTHANGYISSLFECTGDERLLETIINSKCMLADGVVIGLGCHYGVSFDVAMLRRLELAFQPVRRSCNQFPPTIALLNEHPELFQPLVGSTVKFDDFGKLMNGEAKADETGTGGP